MVKTIRNYLDNGKKGRGQRKKKHSEKRGKRSLGAIRRVQKGLKRLKQSGRVHKSGLNKEAKKERSGEGRRCARRRRKGSRRNPRLRKKTSNDGHIPPY